MRNAISFYLLQFLSYFVNAFHVIIQLNERTEGEREKEREAEKERDMSVGVWICVWECVNVCGCVCVIKSLKKVLN